MNDVSSLLAQATVTVPPVDKRAEVAAAGLKKQLDFQAIATARATGRGSLGVTGFEWDLKNLDPAALEFKYGRTGVNAMAAVAEGSTQNLADVSAIRNRGALEAVYDTTTGVVAGAAGSLGGLGALGVSLFNDEAGAAVGEAVQDGMAWVEGTQSDGVNAARRQQRMRSGLDYEDNTAQYEQDVADDKLLPGLRRWGRDAIDTLDNSTDNGTMMVQGTSEATGSLLAGGPLVKGLRALGSVSLTAAKAAGVGARVTAPAARVGSWGAWPAGIAGLEAGGAYSGTVAEGMAKTEEELQKNSQSYRELRAQGLSHEEAKLRVVDTAAKQAATIQGVVGLISGGLSRWAETPLKIPTLRDAVMNTVVKEPLEETIQGTTGSLAQNFAIQQNVDNTRVMSEGVGEQTALGALYGFTSAGAVQGPGMAVQGVVNGVVGTKNYFAGRAAAAEEAAEKASPVSEEKVQAASSEARKRMPALMDNLVAMINVAEGTTEEGRNRELTYVTALGNSLEITPEEIQSLPLQLQKVVAGAEDRATVIHKLGRAIVAMKDNDPARNEAMAAYARVYEPFQNVLEEDLPILNAMEAGKIKDLFSAVRGVIVKANSTPYSRKAEQRIDAAIEAGVVTPAQISVEAMKTPEGQKAAQELADITAMRPGVGNMETLKLLMEHADNGLVKLSVPKRVALNATLAVLTAQEKINQAKGPLSKVDIVNGQIMSEQKDRDEVGESGKVSARMHVNRIMGAVQRGNTKSATALLEDFGKFAQHMQNKLDAFNRHYKAGNPNAKGISFEALSDDDAREFFESEPYIYTNTGSEASILTAQTAELEAQTLTSIYNGLVDTFVELGIQLPKKPEVSLDPGLKGDIKEVVARHKKDSKPTAETESKPAPKQEDAPKPKAEEKKAEPTPTPEEINKQWFKSDRQDIRPDDGRARMKIGDTMITYDRKGDSVNIRNVFTPKELRTGGSGRKAMNKFLALTDELGLSTELSVAGYGKDTDPVKLRKFYTSLGFGGEGDTLTRVVGGEVVEPEVAPVPVVEVAPKPEAKPREVFPTSASGFTPMNREQAEGIEKIQAFLADPKAGRVFVLDGKAGTGKTTIMQEALYRVLSRGRTVHIAAVSHKAKTVLEEKLNNYMRKANLPGEVIAKSLAGLMGMEQKWNSEKQENEFVITKKSEDTAPILNASVIVVDEASMLDQGAIDNILKMASPSAKIIFLGDIGQLAPIDGNGEISPIFTTKSWPKHNLVERVRQGEDSAILPYADYYWDNSQSSDPETIPVPVEQRVNKEGLTFLKATGEMLAQYGQTFLQAVKDRNPNLIKVVAFNNKEKNSDEAAMLRALEYKIRKLVHGKTELAEWEVGDMVIMNNNYRIGETTIDNSREFVVTGVSPGKTIQFEIDGKMVDFLGNLVTVYDHDEQKSFTMPVLSKADNMAATKRLKNLTQAWGNKIAADKKMSRAAKSEEWAKFYKVKEGAAELTYGFVITAHKAQGSTYGTSIVLEDNFNNSAKHDELNVSRGIYTAITRASKEVVIVSRLNPADQDAVVETPVASVTETAPVGAEATPEAVTEPEATPGLTLEERRARNAKRNAEVAAKKEAAAKLRAEADAAEAEANKAPAHKDANPELLARYPDLGFKENSYNLLTTMLPVEGSRLVGVPEPRELAVDTLSSQENLEEVVGGPTKHELTPEVAEGYSELLGTDRKTNRPTLKKVLDIMANRLNEFVQKNAETIEKGVEVNRWVNGKPLNIVNETEGYNKNLVESAGLAAMQWMLGGHAMFTEMDNEDLESLAGVPDAGKLADIKVRLQTGIVVEDVKFAIAAKIREYWGMKPDADGPKAYTDGIAEAVAAELMQGMMAVGFLKMDSIIVGPQHGLPQPPKKADGTDGPKVLKTINRFTFTELAIPESVRAYPSAIDEMVLVEHEPVRFIDEDVPPVANTQMNNPNVENAKDQKRAIKKANGIASRISLPMLNVWAALGVEGVQNLFGKLKPSWSRDAFDKDHAESVRGRLSAIENAFKEIENLTAEMANRAEKAGKPLKAMTIRFAHNMSKVGRLQMLGAHTPQGSKSTREIVLPTWSTLDLVENKSHKLNFMLAIGQHLGVKVDKRKIHQVAPGKFAEATQQELDTTYAPVVTYLRNWMKGVDLDARPGSDIAALDSAEIMKLVNNKPLLEAGLHSLVEYARFLEQDEAGQKSFETPLYLEADGVTNGPIMAMMMMASGGFTPEWIKNVQKGGVHFGSKKGMHDLIGLDDIDLYKTATMNMTSYRDSVVASMKAQNDAGGDKALESVRALFVVMDRLFDGDVKLNFADNTVTFERGVAKNPLTITIYGSSAPGIAGNFASQIMDLLAQERTEINSFREIDKNMSYADMFFKGDVKKWDEYDAALKLLLTTTIGFKQDQGYFQWKPKGGTEYDMLSGNLLHALVTPMVSAISETVTPTVMENARRVRIATQVQSIFLEQAYKEEIEKALVEKGKTVDGWKTADFLSKNDFKAIDEKIALRFPNVVTKSQVFRVAKTQRYKNDKIQYSRGLLENDLRTDAQGYIPANAGVSGIATLVIGFGDAYMIQVFLGDPAMDGNLPVFDGINMPLDKLDTQGKAANKAALAAMMQNNVKPVAVAYDSFLAQLRTNKVEVTEKMLKDLARAFQEPNKLPMTTEDMAKNLSKYMDALSKRLATVSNEIDARHAAMMDVPMSVDHMASANAPYTNGVEMAEMSPEQVLALLNERYQFHLNKPQPKVVEKPIQFGDRDKASGALLTPVTDLSEFSDRVDLTREQQVILSEVISSLSAQDYLIVSGTREQIAQYRSQHGFSNDKINEKTNGFMVPNEKRVYLINADGEVLAHELIHAATIETLMAYYAGDRSKPEVNQSIEKLEVMMKEFMAMPVDWSNADLAEAMNSAQEAIRGHLKNKDRDPVSAQAAALSEFMAWTLANKQLSEKLKTTFISEAAKWVKATIDFIRNLLGKKQQVYRPSNDFLSNIQFNTSVLMHYPLKTSEMFDNITLHHAPSGHAGLDTLRNDFRKLIIDQIKGLPKISMPYARNEMAKYLTEVREVAQKASTAFGLDAIQRSTMVTIVGAMGTEVQLDSDAMAGMQELYIHAQKNLDISSFMDPNDPNSAHMANEKFRLVMGKADRRVDSLGRTTLLPVFIALAAVSPEFREVLSKMPLPKKMEGAKTLDNGLRQFGDNLLDSMSKRLSGQKKTSVTVRAAMDDMIDQLQETLHKEHSMIDVLESQIDKQSLGINGYLRDKLSAVSDAGMKYAETVLAKNPNKAQSFAAKVLQLTAGMANEKNGGLVAEGSLATAERLGLNNTLFNLVKDFIGRTDDTASIYDLIKPIRAAVQQIRQQFRDSVPKVISETFKKTPTAEQYATMFRSMAKTDLASVIGLLNKADILKLFQDQAFLDQQINTLERQLRSMDGRHYRLLRAKMDQLANYMNTGEQGVNLLRNAHAVSNLWNERPSGSRNPVTPEMETLVDQLTTLYAVDRLKATDKSAMASLVQSEAEGMDFVLSYLEGQRKTEMAKTSRPKARANYFKGYTPSLPTKAGNLIVADDSEYVNLTQRGYTRIRAYQGSDLLNLGQSRSYYYSDIPARAAFSQGIMQNVDQTAYGIDPASGFSHEMTVGRIVSKRLVSQLAASMRNESNTVENLMPVYNEKGKVIAFEQSMDPKEAARLEKSEQLHEMLGVWRGRQVEERFSVQQNKQLIEALKKDWDKNKNATPDLYVNLFDRSVLDSVERDAVNLFSDEAKTEIEAQFGKNVFMVRRAVLEDVTGYRNASVSDFWTNINRMDDKTNKAVREVLIATMGSGAYRKLMKAEQIIQGAVADIRTLIIVKSMIVPAANTVSNIYQLMGRGVNPIRIAKEAPSVVTQLHSYTESKLEQIRLEAQLRAVGGDAIREAKLRAKIKSISDAHRRLAIWPLIEAGEFSTVADVGMSRNDLQLTSGRLDEWVGNQIDKLPPALQTAARYGLITKETALFQGLQKSVQYGDFVAKAILYNHLREKEGMTKEQALARITEEFVNYDRLPGRTRAGLENMGMLWFYNFKLRMVKVAVSTIRNNPLHALLVAVMPMPAGVGTPLDENLITKFMEDGLGYTIGPGLALRAPFMNPWINVLN